MITCKRFFLHASASALLVPLIAAAPARANVINVGGVFYEVAFSSITYNSNPTLFNPAPLGQMPWWGDAFKASGFAAEVYDQLGLDLHQPGYGAVFAYAASASAPGEIYGIVQNTSDLNDQLDLDVSMPLSMATAYPFAIASLAKPVSVPVPVPLFGLAVGSVLAKRLRARSKAVKGAGPRRGL